MDKIIAFVHKYGYVAMEEAPRIVILGLIREYAMGWIWFGIFFTSIAFGLLHWRYGLKAVLGCMLASVALGAAIAYLPHYVNVAAVILAHLAWALRDKLKQGG